MLRAILRCVCGSFLSLTSLCNSWLFPEPSEVGQNSWSKRINLPPFFPSHSFQQPAQIAAECWGRAVLRSLSGGGLQALTLSAFLLVEVCFCSSCEDGISLQVGRHAGPGIFLVLTDYLKYISSDKIFSF